MTRHDCTELAYMTGEAKAHDPLCRWHGDSARWEVCRDCTTIAKARADQTERCIEAMAAVEGGYSVPLGMSVGMFIDAMRQEFIAAALRALQEKP